MNARFTQPDRRTFFAQTGAMAAFFAAHGCFAGDQTADSKQGDKPMPRILSLELLSAAPLDKLKEFYHEKLGLSVVENKRDRLVIQTGESRIAFVPAGADDGKPFYHFAFNIPENKILAARIWQTKRTPLLPIPARLRDAKYPDEVVDYRHWNAHSIFFYDPAGNVVEYIARHDLKNEGHGEFTSKDILCASEIGLIVDDVAATADKLKEIVGVDQYKGGSDKFIALGDEQGLLLVMKRGRILNFADSSDDKAAKVFHTSARVRGAKQTKHTVAEFPYEIHVES